MMRFRLISSISLMNGLKRFHYADMLRGSVKIFKITAWT